MTRRSHCRRSTCAWPTSDRPYARGTPSQGVSSCAVSRLSAIALTLVKLGRLATDIPAICELDLNPLLADENGVLVVDSRIAVRPPVRPTAAKRWRTAIRPYPNGWERVLALRDGTAIDLRPVPRG